MQVLPGDLLQAMHAHRWVELPWMGAPDFDRAKYIQSLARLLTQKAGAGVCSAKALCRRRSK